MIEPTNLIEQMEERLTEDIFSLLKAVAELADARREALYLVGGAVRDLLLSRPVVDFDLVVEGDAPGLVLRFAETTGGRVSIYRRFGTAKLEWGHSSLDLVTARSETYERPGALPKVKAGSIRSDLFRRDFTINAMAIRLNATNFGQLVDPYGGRSDLESRLIRVLHNKSFIDDATRIFRAIRYEQRLGFRLEPETEELIRRDVAMISTVSGDRIRHELELILQEERPERILRRMDGLGVLAELHPSLVGDEWLIERFERARQSQPEAGSQLGLYLALIAYRLDQEENESLIQRLRIHGKEAKIMRDALQLKESLPALLEPNLLASGIYRLLGGLSPKALQAVSLVTNSPIVQQRLAYYLSALRYVKSSLDGKALMKMGVPSGPHLGEMLRALRNARLDGKVRTKEEEEALVHRWLAEMNE